MAFKITLNGANYVDANRQRAFEAALAEDKGTLGHSGGNGQSSKAAETLSPTPAAAATVMAGDAVRTESSALPSVVVVQDYDRVLDGLERGLAKSYEHQSETLKVHQQYLSNQAAYASIFAQLMQEQGTLFSGETPVSGQSDVLLQILQSLSHSVAQFHEHQAETLTVHSQFLDQQSTYAQAFVDLLQTHYGTALTGGGVPAGNGHTHGNGNGNGKGHFSVPVVQAPVRSTRQPAAVVEPTVVTAPQPEAPVETAHVEPVAQVATPVSTPVPASGTGGLPVSAAELSTALLEIVSEKTGYPAEMLELEMDMEADLGIDSIKRVEILGALQDAYPTLPEIETEALAELRTLAHVLDTVGAQSTKNGDAAPAMAALSAVAISSEAPVAGVAPVVPVATATQPEGQASSHLAGLGDELLVIVSEKTGYPAEMLELGMDMEADLGIDSIKRVEILGALQDAHPDLPEVETEALSELRTLAQILDYMRDGDASKKA